MNKEMPDYETLYAKNFLLEHNIKVLQKRIDKVIKMNDFILNNDYEYLELPNGEKCDCISLLKLSNKILKGERNE